MSNLKISLYKLKNNMNKIIIGTVLSVTLASAAFAMEMNATGTMMDKHMMASGTKMMKEDMKKEVKSIMKEDMKKCMDTKKASRAEVKAFQKANGIAQTGFIGKLTKAKLAKMDCMKEVMSDMSSTTMMMKAKMSSSSMMHATGTMMHN
jgi:hypothetical protein